MSKTYVGLFAKTVYKARGDRAMTLEAMAKKFRTHKGYLSGIENAKVAPPTMRYIRRMASAYGLDLKALAMMSWLEKAPQEIQDEASALVTGWIEKNEPPRCVPLCVGPEKAAAEGNPVETPPPANGPRNLP